MGSSPREGESGQVSKPSHLVFSLSLTIFVSSRRGAPQPTATALPPCWPDCEPNETFSQAQGPLASGQVYQGHIESETDQNDYFFVDMATAHTIEVSLRNIPVGANYHLYLYDSVQNLVGYSGNAGNADEYILTNPLLASRYYVRVQRVAGYSPAQAYLLQVRYQ